MFILPRSATVPPFTGVFSLSFFGFTTKISKIETLMSNCQTRYNYQKSLACFYYLINKLFCYVFPVQKSSAVQFEYNRPFV